MKISELEKKLAEIREREGDLEVRVSHLWSPDPQVIAGRHFGQPPTPDMRYVLINP